MPPRHALAGHQPLLLRGQVHHARLRPVRHAFTYPSWFVLLPLRALRKGGQRDAGALPRNRRALASFHDADHGAGGADALAWAEALLARVGVRGADGEIWLQTYPRLLGFAFKPVSFWYCLRSDGTLAAVLAEVNNTFGERHVYLLDGPGLAWGAEATARKVFHVSPFCAVQGRYRFRFGVDAGRLLARVDHDDDAGPLLRTSAGGALQPLGRGALLGAIAAMPLLTLGVVARIHWQALRLWLRRVPVFHKPAPPGEPITRASR